MNSSKGIKAVALLLLAAASPLRAEELSLEAAVQLALKNYPAVRVATESVSASQAGVGLARTSYLPRADFLWQTNRATRNKVFGLLLPPPIVSPISGPVLGTNDTTSVWGSATGLLVSWEPFDFGLRKANVLSAESAQHRAEASASLTRLQVAAAAADAYLTVLAAEQRLRAAAAGVERARVFFTVVDAQVKAGLRPGVDSARARAELAGAETQRIQAEQGLDVARVGLAQIIGASPASLRALPALPDSSPAAAVGLDTHPLAREQSAAVDEAKAREKALERSYFPKFNVQANTYGRGTGALTNGGTLGGANGLGPSTGNWAVGMTVTFASFDRPSIHARQEIEAHRELAEAARYDKTLTDLNGQLAKAKSVLDGARKVAANTPIQLDAAQAAERQAAARYQSGLGTVLEVADTMRLRTQSEIDDALARLAVWRAFLGVAYAQGDLAPVLQAGK